MRRRPALCLLTSALAMVTAAVLIGSALTIAAPRVANLSTANDAVVHAFYEALNTTIRTGDAADLNAVVAADFISHDALPGVTPDRAGLERYLATVHATAPGAEIVVKDVTAVGNRALVRVAVHDEEEKRAFLGVSPRDRPPVWGRVDAFRIDGRQVVEHWGGTPGLALLEPLSQAALDLNVRDRPLLSLDRISIPAGGTFAAKGASEARLLYVESGIVTVTSTPYNEKTSRPATDSYTSGAIFAVPTWSQTELRNDGSVAANLLVVAATEPSVGNWMQEPELSDSKLVPAYDAGTMQWPHGIALAFDDGFSMTPLAGNVQTTLPGQHPVIAVGRATLAPGADLSLHQANGPGLLAIEQGALALTVGGEDAWVRHAESGGSMSRDVDTLATGDGVLLDTGTIALLSNRGHEPVVLTFVAVLPPGASA
ncbi:MAG: nuclear transport factor 2 family protein [Thermomicrobiales bacterium]